MEIPVRRDEGVAGIGRPSLELTQRGLSSFRQAGAMADTSLTAVAAASRRSRGSIGTRPSSV